ncbi:MAG: hypothetical protein J5542_02440 [Bacteroidales bacterium]|nr:hypothetical protein [Bacteroidales bacterium]
MEETKRCPYCGEEILAVARKCKHCGEWLDKDNSQEKNQNPSPDDNEINTPADSDAKLLQQNIPFSKTIIKIAMWVAIIGIFISMAHDILPNGSNVSEFLKGGRGVRFIAKSLLFVLSLVPIWISCVLEAIGAVVLLYSLKRAMSTLKKNFDNLFNWLIITFCVMIVLNIISGYTDSWEMYLFIIPLSLVPIIVQIILGVKISAAYKGDIKKLGLTMAICAILNIISTCVYVFLIYRMYYNDITSDIYALEVGFSIFSTLVYVYYYNALREIQVPYEKKEKKKEKE